MMSLGDSGTVLALRLQNRWDRALVILSIPHGAAFGAFYGKLTFADLGWGSRWAFLASTAMIAIMPLAVAWLFLINDLLRNTFLRVGHGGTWLKIKHSMKYYFTVIAPVLLIFMADSMNQTENKVGLALICTTIFSWGFSAILIANQYYSEAMSDLGVTEDD